MTTIDRKSKAETREENERLILQAAEKVFAVHGFKGSTTTQIADEAGLPKANVHYYYATKLMLYKCVLKSMLEDWMAAAEVFNTHADPVIALSRYIEAKMDLSRRRPYGSRVWAKEIMSGAPVMEEVLSTILKQWVDECEATINHWVAEHKIQAVNGKALLYMIWATTQHYADFDRQIVLLNDGHVLSDQAFSEKKQQVIALILASVGLHDLTIKETTLATTA
jgi:TetR/AcrR family transcriptional regulator